jgi:hypothetical protein
MAKGKPVLTHVTYFPKKGKEKELCDLVKLHWPTLKKAGLATSEPAKNYEATDIRSGRVYFIEIYSWVDDEAPRVAHQMPEVMAVWEPMGNIMEGFNGTGSPIAIAQLEPLAL